MIQNTHPTPSLIWGCMLWEKRRVRSLGFLVTVLPLACWGTTEKLLGLFGLSFLLCKVSGGWAHDLSSIRPALLGAEMQWAPIHASDSVPGAEEAATNTRKPLPSEGFHFSVECSPLPLPLKSPPKLPQTILSPLSPFLHPPIILQLLQTMFLLQPLPRKNSNKRQQLPYVHNIQQIFIWSSFYLRSMWKVTPLWFSSFINSLPQHTFFWKWLLLLLNI